MPARRWLIAIVTAGAALRLVPVWFGLPYLHARPDEPVATGVAMQVLAGDPNPHFFHWPSLTFYLFAAVFWLAGLVTGPEPLTQAEQFVIGRTVVACAGAATILVVFSLGRRMTDEATGLIAAALLAVAMLHVRDSHFAMTDVLMTLLATASLALLLRAMDEHATGGALRWYAAAGAAAGLASSTKYNAAAVVAGMAAAQLLILNRNRRPSAWLPSIAYALCFVAAFLIATPYALLDFSKFKEDVIFDVTHLSGGHGVDLGRGWIYHLTRSLPYGLGPTAFAAAVVGVVALARHHRRHAFVLGTCALAYYASIGSGYTVFFRYVLPLVPLGCVAAAAGVRQVVAWLSGVPGGRRALMRTAPAYGIVLALTVGPGLVNSVWFDVLLARTDSRVAAAEWLVPRLRPHHTLHDAGGIYCALDLARARVRRLEFDAATASFTGGGQPPDWLVLYQSPLYTYTRMPGQLQTLAQTGYRRVHTVRASTPRRTGVVYDLQDAFFMPVWGFWNVDLPGPTIHIYLRNGVPLEEAPRD